MIQGLLQVSPPMVAWMEWDDTASLWRTRLWRSLSPECSRTQVRRRRLL